MVGSNVGIEKMGHLLSFVRMIQIILKARRILFLGRNVPRKPPLQDGAKGHNIKGNYFTGKPRP
jgi:hypothetical protein